MKVTVELARRPYHSNLGPKILTVKVEHKGMMHVKEEILERDEFASLFRSMIDRAAREIEETVEKEEKKDKEIPRHGPRMASMPEPK